MKAFFAKANRQGLSAHTLKTIAIVAMLTDHIGAAFIPMGNALGLAMRIVGRLTAPIMCFFIAEGYHKTGNIKKYAMRLGIFAIISHFAFSYAWGEYFPIYLRYGIVVYPTSVMFPLLLGLLALVVWNQNRLPNWVKTLSVIVLCLLSAIGDWGPLAVLWVLFFGIYHGDFKNQAIAFILITLPYSILEMTTGFGFPEQKIMGVIQIASLLTLPLLRQYNGQLGGGKRLRWFFYWFYPLHLLAIGLIKRFL